MNPFKYSVKEIVGRNEYSVSLKWGSYKERQTVKTIEDADNLRKMFRAHCKRMFHSEQVVYAGRLD